MRYASHYGAKANVPQSEPIPGEVQVKNEAGGYVYPVDDWKRLDRFLILGTEGGTYYAAERQLTRENAKIIEKLVNESEMAGACAVNRIVEVSEKGLAPKNDPAIFALAIAAGSKLPFVREHALSVLPKVCRTGTHLFHFVDAVEGFRGWGRALRRAITRWYNGKSPDDLAMQLVKYRQRGRWSHRDILRLSHAKPEETLGDLFRWAAKGQEPPFGKAPAILEGFLKVQAEESPAQVEKLVSEYRLPLEAVPPEKQSDGVWRAVFPHLGLTALLRNLGNLTARGILKSGHFENLEIVKNRLLSLESLKKGRIHPVHLLVALLTYRSGHGVRGQNTWEPVSDLVDMIGEAFYLSFQVQEPTKKRFCLGLDISGSMFGTEMLGVPNLSAAMMAGALALVAWKTEPFCTTMAFTDRFEPVQFSRNSTLDSVVHGMNKMSKHMGRTDCSLPMIWALKNRVEADVFVILTDNETWAGHVHPSEALRSYRRETGIPAKLAVVALTSTGFSIADPSDAGMLDLVGCSLDTPQILSAFVRGDV